MNTKLKQTWYYRCHGDGTEWSCLPLLCTVRTYLL